MKKWVLRISLALVVLTIASGLVTFFVIEDSLDRMYGADTVLAEPAISSDSPDRYVVDNVWVLTPSGDAFEPGQSILIEDGRIQAVSSATEAIDTVAAIDGRGLYVVPGYTDSHVHLWDSPNDLLLYLANGVTQVREMHGRPHHLQWRREIEAGRPGPDIYVVAAQLATYGFWEGLWTAWTAKRNVVRSPQATEQAIRSLQRQGYDAVKASSFLSLAGYRAATRTTREHDIPLVGHLPVAATLPDLWSSNQTELAHVEEVVKALDREFGGYGPSDTKEFLEYVRTRRHDVARQLAERHIPVASTLALINSIPRQAIDLGGVLPEVELGYVNPGVLEGRAMGWFAEFNRYRAPDRARSGNWRERYSSYWSAYAQAQQLVFEAMLDAGVIILAGTDANVPVMVPGLSLHEEFKALEAGGMTAEQVLASATSAPARWMGWNTGQISPGYQANLVLLRENPLENIDATDSIETVIKSGRIFTRADLDAMLHAVEQANRNSRTVPLD